jgi:hypothetical protein
MAENSAGPGSCRPSAAEHEGRWLPAPGDSGDLLPVGIIMTTVHLLTCCSHPPATGVDDIILSSGATW